jgi:hypothetical protein
VSNDNLIQFPLRPTPMAASDELIAHLWALLNAETIFSNRPVIDLTKRVKLKTEKHGLFSNPVWLTVDEVTFDPDPESRWYIVGTGKTEADSKIDLLDKLHTEYQRAGR